MTLEKMVEDVHKANFSDFSKDKDKFQRVLGETQTKRNSLLVFSSKPQNMKNTYI